jgi:hypothetical protein
MNTSSWPRHWDNIDWQAGLERKPAGRPQPSSPLAARKSSDPSLVSISAGEMQRLLDIEHSAEVALRAMSAIRSPDQRVTDAASALASALANPAMGG